MFLVIEMKKGNFLCMYWWNIKMIFEFERNGSIESFD